ncbi:MAG: tycC2, partial [Pedosphaera sp.]|nr:tycC2 [Pedosphaera sp.]
MGSVAAQRGGYHLLTTSANRLYCWALVKHSTTMPADNRTIGRRSDLPEAAANATKEHPPESSAGDAAQFIPRQAQPEHVPLSFAQERLWFLDQLYPQSPLYNFPVALRIKGPLDLDALRYSLSFSVVRHEVLRTSFVAVEGNPTQVISDRAEVELPMTDLSAMADALREAEAQRLVAAEAQRPFNLAKDPMLRGWLLKLAPDEHILMVTIHHIATDAWSAGVLFRELAAGYKAFSVGREPVLPELPIQYADFAAWQRDWLQGETLQKHLAYWKQRLAGAKESLDLPLDRPRPATPTFAGAIQARPLRHELMEALKKVSQRERATLFMTLLAAFKTLLWRYSGQEDILVGIPIAGRNRMETEN